MSYDKIYPEVPSAPPDDRLLLAKPQEIAAQQEHESQSYRLKKIDEMEKFLRGEVEARDKLGKQYKRRSTAMTVSDTTVITAITALELGSVVTLTTGIGFPISIALASAGLILGLSTAIIHKSQKIFNSKVRKHERIKTLAESKLDSISGLISKAVEDAHISHDEYQFILKEVEQYRTLKEQIRTKSKRTVDAITKEQREAILQQGREEGKQAFLRKLANTSVTPPANPT